MQKEEDICKGVAPNANSRHQYYFARDGQPQNDATMNAAPFRLGLRNPELTSISNAPEILIRTGAAASEKHYGAAPRRATDAVWFACFALVVDREISVVKLCLCTVFEHPAAIEYPACRLQREMKVKAGDG
jgi:hypothetical protein